MSANKAPFVNGAADPWAAASFTEPRHAPAGLNVFVIHGEDLHNLEPDDLLGVFQALSAA
jgi:hypothetical protein